MRARKSDRFQISKWHAYSFALGILASFAALVSPIDSISDILGSVHMIQHTLLMMVAAPLMAAGAPAHIAKWGLPARFWQSWRVLKRRLRTRFALLTHMPDGIRRPAIIWTLYSVTLWLWHLPSLYQAALENQIIHDIQHLAFFITSFLFWRILIDPVGYRDKVRKNLNPGAGVLYLFVASLHAMILGVFMAVSPSVWYPLYSERTTQYGLSALIDQQIAGYIMWMPAGITYVIVAAYLVIRLINASSVSQVSKTQ